MKKFTQLFLLFIILLTALPLVAAEHEPIQTDSVYLPDDVTSGSCAELREDKAEACEIEEPCTCADGSQCDQMVKDEKVVITFFYSETCPHCHEGLTFLEELSQTRDDFIVEKYEVLHNSTSREYAVDFCEKEEVPFNSVPTYFIGDKYFVGYSSSMNEDILEAIDLVHLTNQNSTIPINESSTNEIKVPILGTLDATTVSIPVLAVVLGFIDGFNPCAFFVLLFLLSMLVYAKSRKRMALIGGIFVFFSGLIYFVFMSAWLNFFLVTQSITIITTIAGLVALTIAAFNIKDFFAFKKGASLSISDKNRKSLIKRMRGLLKAENIWTMIVGTVVLAVSANLYELLCTAGFPMVFTKALTLQNLPTASYYLYLLLYNVVYIIPLLVIVIIFTATLGSKKLSQEQGETLKLMSGMMMLALGGMLVFKPALLNNMVASISLILLALIITFTIVFIKRRVKSIKDRKKEEVGERKIKEDEK